MAQFPIRFKFVGSDEVHEAWALDQLPIGAKFEIVSVSGDSAMEQPRIDAGYIHEVLDRANYITSTLQDVLADHPAVMQSPMLAYYVEMAQQAVMAAYQIAGGFDLVFDENPGVSYEEVQQHPIAVGTINQQELGEEKHVKLDFADVKWMIAAFNSCIEVRNEEGRDSEIIEPSLTLQQKLFRWQEEKHFAYPGRYEKHFSKLIKD